MKTAITIMIMLYFQLCHKPKHLRGILRQPVKPKHSWAVFSPLGMFHHEMSNSCYTEESRGSWVIARRLLSLRDESHHGDLLQSGCGGRFHSTHRRPHAQSPMTRRSSVMRCCQTWGHDLLPPPIHHRPPPSLHPLVPVATEQAFLQNR